MKRIGSVVRLLIWLPLLLSGVAALPRAVDAIDIFLLRHDAVAVMRYRLMGVDPATYKTEAEAALAADDPELARSIVELARAQGLAVDPSLQERVAEAEEFSLTRTAGEVWRGAVTGEADTPVAFSAALASDLTVVGDLRDLAIEAEKIPNQDNLTVALAATGVALTVALAPSGASALPAKVGVSALKAAKKLRLLAKPLERQLVRLTTNAIDTAAARSLLRNARNFDGRAVIADAARLVRKDVVTELSDTGGALQSVLTRQGYRATLQTLGRAESTVEIRRLNRVSEHFGPRYRGALAMSRGARLTLRAGEWLWHALGWLAAAFVWAVTIMLFCIATLRRLFQLLRWQVRWVRGAMTA
jgi:hypothetical protein